MAKRIAEMIRVRFSCKFVDIKREVYTDNLVKSTKEAITTLVAIYASFESPLFIGNVLRIAP